MSLLICTHYDCEFQRSTTFYVLTDEVIFVITKLVSRNKTVLKSIYLVVIVAVWFMAISDEDHQSRLVLQTSLQNRFEFLNVVNGRQFDHPCYPSLKLKSSSLTLILSHDAN